MRLPLGVGGILLLVLLGAVEDDGIDTLIEKIRRTEAGDEDVEFTTDADGQLGELYDAVGDLAERARSSRVPASQNEHYREELYRIVAGTEDADETISQLLELGCERLNVENGHVVAVDRDAGSHEVLAAAGSDLVEHGAVSPLSETFCRHTIEQEGILCVYDAEAEDWSDDPAVEEWGIHCYVGAKLLVDGELFGTLCFVDREPRAEPFDHAEKVFVDLMARWISQLYERRAHESDIARHREEFESLVQAVEEYAIFMLDEEGHVQSWNEGAEQINGYSAEEVLGEHVSTFYSEADREDGVPERNLERAAAEGSVHDEGWWIRADGSRFWASVTITAVTDEAGDRRGFLTVTRDMTQHREREEALRETSERLGAVIEASPAAILVIDADGIVQLWNPGAEHIFGWSEDEVLGDPLPIVPEDRRDEFEAYRDRLLDGGSFQRTETTRLTADDERIDVSLSAAPMYDDGEVSAIVGVFEDISERKQRERELAETKRKLEIALEGTNTGVWEWDMATDELRWDETLEASLGMESGAFEGTSEAFERRVHPDDLPAVEAAIEQSVERGEPYQTDFRLQHADGSWVWFAARGRPVDEDGQRLVGILNDITERKHRERDLAESTRHFEAVFQDPQILVGLLEPDGTLQRINDTAMEYVVAERDDLHGEPFPETPWWAETPTDRVEDWIERAAAGEYVEFEAKHPGPEDDSTWINGTFRPVTNDEGEVVGIVVSARDVTDRKQRAQDLESARNRLAEHNRTLKRLGEISADRDTSLGEKIQQVLDLGRERLGTKGAFLSTIDRDADRFTFDYTSGAGPDLEPDTVAPFSETYCRKAVDSEALLEVTDAAEQGWLDDPAYDRWQFDWYVGHRIYVEGALEGTLGFVDPDPAPGSLTDEQRTFVELASHWLSYELERERREGRLAEYKEFTDDVLDAIDDVFYVLDEDGRLTRWNETLVEVTGYSDAEIEGTTLSFFDEAHHDVIAEAITEAFETGSTRVEAPFLTKEGEQIPYEFAAVEMTNLDGDPVLVGIGRDISERVETERRLSRIVSNVPGFVYRVKNARGWPTEFVSEGIRDIAGYDPGALEQGEMVWADMFAPEADPDRVWATVQARLDDEEPFHLVYPIETPDGERRWVKEQGRGVYADDGSVEALEGVVIDVTERVEYEHELERAQTLLEQSERLAQVGAWEIAVADGEPVGLTMSEQSYHIHDLEPGTDLAVDEAIEYFHPDDRDRIFAGVERAIEAGEGYDIEARLVTAEGGHRWVRTIADPVREDGETVTIRGSIQDITERKERQEQLERAMDLLGRAEEMIDLGGWSVDMSGEPPYQAEWTDKLYDLYGVPRDEAPPTMDIVEYYHPEDRDRHAAAIKRALEDGETWDQELRLDTDDGTEQWVRNIGEPVVEDGEVVEIRGSVQDITDRKARQEQLERTMDLLGRAEDMAGLGGWSVEIVDGEPTAAEWTETLYEIFEIPHDVQPYADGFLEYFHPDDRESHAADLRRAREDGDPWDREVRIVTEDGTDRWVRTIGEPVVEDGEVVEIRGSVQDITDRKEREEQLRRREQDMQAHTAYTDDILDAIEDVFYVIDDEGTFKRWNASLRRATGFTDEEIAETNALEFFPEEDLPAVMDAMEVVLAEGGIRRVEARLVTKEGEPIPYEFVAAPVENPDGERVLAGIGRDITERKRRQAELERTTELLEQAQRIASIGGWEYDLATEELTVTDEFRRLHDLDPDGELTLADVLAKYHPDDREYVEQTIDETIDWGRSYDMEVRLQRDDGRTIWARALGEAVERDGEVVKLRGSVQDITAQKEHEQALHALHDAAEGLLQTESEDGVAQLVVETADDVLDVAGVCLFLLDETTNQLVPEACTKGFAGTTTGVTPVTVGDEDHPVWNSFATGTRRVLDEGDDATGLFAGHVGGALVVPVGDHGVLAVTTEKPGITGQTRRLVETVVATTEAALDRLESEAAVRERDEALAAQNRRLRRQIQLTDVLRRVDQSLISADSQETVEAAVTEELASAEDISFAWIGRLEAGSDRLVPQAWAGTGESYLDGVSLAVTGGNEPAVATARSGEPTVVSNVVADLGSDGWRKPALDSGFKSVLAVPIALDEYSYGVLAVYAAEPDSFEDLEREVFADLGRTIASAINTVQTREALHADRILALTLNLGDSDSFLATVAREAGSPVEYVGTASRSGDVTRLFFAAECDVSDVLAEMVTVSEYRLLSQTDDRWVFEAAVTGDPLPARLLRHGASPESIRATPTGLSVEVHLPTGTDVREFVEMLRQSYDTVELESRQTIERPTRTRQQVVGDLLADLTDRQREVLRTAYYAGFFDWPRESTGEELAEMLGITQPTVSRHLRHGQRSLLEQVFDEEVVPVEA